MTTKAGEIEFEASREFVGFEQIVQTGTEMPNDGISAPADLRIVSRAMPRLYLNYLDRTAARD